MSHIETIEIKNFKSIQHQKIEGCKRINVFVGAPNVGKSNILEALSNFSINSDYRLYSDIVRVDKATTLFFYGKIDESSEIILNKYFRIILTYEKFGLDAKYQIDRFRKGFSEVDKEIQDAGIFSRSTTEDNLVEIGRFNVSEDTLEIGNIKGSNNLRIFEDNSTDFALSLLYKSIPILKYEFKKDIKYESKSALQFEHPFGKNLFEIISNKSKLLEEITTLFKTYELNFVYDSRNREYEILKMLEGRIFTVPYIMVADTLQRLIFYKTAVAANKKTVLLFEEPEAHMYPPYISKFTSDMMFDRNDNQFFITTHSPFVINDIMENLKKDDYAIYTVGYNTRTGETLIRKLTEQELQEIYQYGIDLFMNLENYLPDEEQK